MQLLANKFSKTIARYRYNASLQSVMHKEHILTDVAPVADQGFFTGVDPSIISPHGSTHVYIYPGIMY